MTNHDRLRAARTVCDQLDFDGALTVLSALGLLVGVSGERMLVRDEFDRTELAPPFVADADGAFTR